MNILTWLRSKFAPRSKYEGCKSFDTWEEAMGYVFNANMAVILEYDDKTDKYYIVSEYE